MAALASPDQPLPAPDQLNTSKPIEPSGGSTNERKSAETEDLLKKLTPGIDPDKALQAIAAEASQEPERASSPDTIIQLLDAGAVSAEKKIEEFIPGFRTERVDVKVDLQKAINVLKAAGGYAETTDELKDPILEEDSSEDEVAEESDQEEIYSSEKTAPVLQKVVKTFVEGGLISPDLAFHVGRLVRPSDTFLAEEMDFGWAIPRGDRFPVTKSERDNIIIGTGIIESEKTWFRNALSESGKAHSLTEADIDDLAMFSIVAHEYGHKIERALVLLKAQDQGIEESDVSSLSKSLHSDIIQTSLDSNLSSLLKEESDLSKKQIEEVIISERIATGFQTEGSRIILKGYGFTETEVSSVLNQITGTKTPQFKSLVDIFANARSKGLSITGLSQGLNEIKFKLRQQRLSKLLDLLPVADIYKYLGYSYPLNAQQLKAFMSSTPIPSAKEQAVELVKEFTNQ